MKSLSFLNGVTILDRTQQKHIFGGVSDHDAPAESGTGGGGGAFATCRALCLDSYGNESILSCSGDTCEQNDYEGCSSNTEGTKWCPW